MVEGMLGRIDRRDAFAIAGDVLREAGRATQVGSLAVGLLAVGSCDLAPAAPFCRNGAQADGGASPLAAAEMETRTTAAVGT